MPPETEPVTEPEPDGGYQVRLRQTVFRGVILASLLVLLVAAGLLLRRKIILNKRQALLDQEDNREAVLWSFADSVGLLQRMGFHRGTGSLDALIVPLRERFGEGFAEGFEAAARIHAKALFSGKPITQPERDTVQSFRRQTLELLQKHSGRLTRLWMKYVLCVY